MRYHSIIILILCMLLPPLLYVASVQTLKNHLQNRYLTEIEEIYLGDTQALFNGTVDLKKTVNENINQYLKNKTLLSWGIKISLTVVSNNGRIIYPMIYDEDEISVQLPNPLHVAEENYILMSEGFKIHADVEIRHNTLLANLIILFYSVLFICGYLFYLRYSNKKVLLKDIEKKEQLKRLVAKEKKYIASLKSYERQRNVLAFELTSLNKEFARQNHEATNNEEEMFNEIIILEERIKKNDRLQNEQKIEMDRLKKEIRFNNENYNRNRPAKDTNTEKKRLNSIYKNINMNDRALHGFMGLTDDLKIKSEGIIHELNDRPSLVSVKRKVFGKKKGETVLETIFGYQGRLYYRNKNNHKIEILVIGTKNTQTKDLEFLKRL